MVWGLIRLALFSGSFMIGLLFVGPSAFDGPPVQPKAAEKANFNGHKSHRVQKNSVTYICAIAGDPI
jgi:hypothetical protein